MKLGCKYLLFSSPLHLINNSSINIKDFFFRGNGSSLLLPNVWDSWPTKPYEYSFSIRSVYTEDRCMESPYSWTRHSWVPFVLILGAISIRPNYTQTNHIVENTYTPQQRIVCFSIVDTQLPFMLLLFFMCSRLIRFLNSPLCFTVPSDFHIFNLTNWTNKFQSNVKWQSHQRESFQVKFHVLVHFKTSLHLYHWPYLSLKITTFNFVRSVTKPLDYKSSTKCCVRMKLLKQFIIVNPFPKYKFIRLSRDSFWENLFFFDCSIQ